MNQHTNTIIPDFCLRVSDLISVPAGSALFPETLLSTPLSSPQQQATTVPLPLSTSVSPVPVVNPLGFGSTLDMNFDFGTLNPSPPAAQSLLSWDSLPLNTSTLDFGAFLDNNTQLQQQYDTQAPTSTGPIANQDPTKWLSDDLFDLSVFGVTTLDNVAAVKSLDPTQFTFVSSSAPSSPVPSLEPLPAHAGTPPPLASPLVGSDATVIYSPTPSMALSTAAAAAAAAAVPHLSPSSLPASPFSLLSQQQHQNHHQQTTLDQLFLDATANVPISTSAAGSPAATVQLATTTVADDLDAILADLPDLEPTTPSAPAPNVVATAAAPPAAKRQRRRPPANELPPIVHIPTLSADTSAAPTTTLAIPTSTRKSKAKVASLPTLLEYPKDMIAHDAPILSNKRKRTNKRSAASSELDTQDEDEDEILPSDPSLVSDPAAAKRITNALSARRSRARKQAKLEFFESRVHELETANAQLAAQVAQLQAQLRAANLVPVQGAGSESALMS